MCLAAWLLGCSAGWLAGWLVSEVLGQITNCDKLRNLTWSKCSYMSNVVFFCLCTLLNVTSLLSGR